MVVKFTKLMILCTILLNACKEHIRTISYKNQSLRLEKKINKNIVIDIRLTNDEQNKINTLMYAFDQIIANIQKQIIKSKYLNQKNKNYLNLEFKIINYQTKIDKYESFIIWLHNNTQKQKKLAHAFNKVYDFLERQRQKHANEMTLEEYIKSAINTAYTDNKNGKYGNYNNQIRLFFNEILDFIFYNKDTNEEIFKYLKKEIRYKSENYYTSKLIKEWR